ncbi:hypothetical protein D3C87_2048710 [compost metagenome]
MEAAVNRYNQLGQRLAVLDAGLIADVAGQLNNLSRTLHILLQPQIDQTLIGHRIICQMHTFTAPQIHKDILGQHRCKRSH